MSSRLLLLIVHKSKRCARLLLLLLWLLLWGSGHVHTTKHVVLLLSLRLLLRLRLGGLLTGLHECKSTGLRLLRLLIIRWWSGK